MMLFDQNYDDTLENKDIWPDPPFRVSLDHTLEQWSAHTMAFDPFGSGGSDRVPMLTVVSDLDRL